MSPGLPAKKVQVHRLPLELYSTRTVRSLYKLPDERRSRYEYESCFPPHQALRMLSGLLHFWWVKPSSQVKRRGFRGVAYSLVLYVLAERGCGGGSQRTTRGPHRGS